MNLIKRLKHFEQGGTVENPKALLREAIAEIERLQRTEQASPDSTSPHRYTSRSR